MNLYFFFKFVILIWILFQKDVPTSTFLGNYIGRDIKTGETKTFFLNLQIQRSLVFQTYKFISHVYHLTWIKNVQNFAKVYYATVDSAFYWNGCMFRLVLCKILIQNVTFIFLSTYLCILCNALSFISKKQYFMRFLSAMLFHLNTIWMKAGQGSWIHMIKWCCWI